MHLSLAEINRNEGAYTNETKEKNNISTTYFLKFFFSMKKTTILGKKMVLWGYNGTLWIKILPLR